MDGVPIQHDFMAQLRGHVEVIDIKHLRKSVNDEAALLHMVEDVKRLQ